MKVIEAIHEADNLRPNLYEVAEKIQWLSRLDLRVKHEVLDTHRYNEGETPVEFEGYGPDDTEEELLVPEPWAEMYIHWLEAQIDYHNMEYDGFNASNAMFESVYGSFAREYNSSHMPIGRKKIYY